MNNEDLYTVEDTTRIRELLIKEQEGNCAYMLRSRDDKATAEEFFDIYGVKL